MAYSLFHSKQHLFNRWAPTYDCLFPSVFYQAIHKRLLDSIQLSNHANVLDLGCGTGRLLTRLAAQFPQLSGTGVDFSPEMLRLANVHNPYPSRLTYCLGDAEALPLPDQQFDAVFNTISFLHYPNPESVLGEVHRVLRSGGNFYLADFSLRWATEPKTFGASPNTSIQLYSPAVREKMGQQVGLPAVAHHYLLGPVLLTVFQKL
jgi:ubiquinone/menaquinone biosynthesis C-methylase UbiE